MYLLIFLLLHSTILPSAGFSGRITEEENEKLKKTCGDSALRMTAKSIGGRGVRPNEFPWIAAILNQRVISTSAPELREQDDGRQVIVIPTTVDMGGCTAVQISRRHILTAAHCVVDGSDKKRICDERSQENWSREQLAYPPYTRLRPEDFTIFVSSSCEHPSLCEDRAKFNITKPPRVHERYNRCDHTNDVAIIELDKDIPPEVGTPICLREEDEGLMSKLTGIGYGVDTIHPMDDNYPIQRLQKIDIDSNDVEELGDCTIRAHLFDSSLCKGDSGGPLVQLDFGKESYVLVGITSSGSLCDKTLPKARINNFANVKCYIDWICEHTGVCPLRRTESYGDPHG